MKEQDDRILDRVYAARTDMEREAAYDAWANSYDENICAFGYRLPAVVAAVFTRFVDVDCAPILDAGCGTGLQTEPLVLAGYGPFVGIDLSSEMLSVAKRKSLHESLHKLALGTELPFDSGRFGATLCIGAITPGHAGPESFDELIRVTRAGGPVVFSLRVDEGQLPEYPAVLETHERSGRWRRRFATPGFPSMPYGEPAVRHAVYVYEILR